jgi:hypothetical protein
MSKSIDPVSLVPSLLAHAGRPTPPTLFHYTNQESFLSIVQKRHLWLSDAVYLNDATELKYGLEKLKAHWDGWSGEQKFKVPRREGLHGIFDLAPEVATKGNVFLASLSERGDDLSQWRAYCRENGGLSVGMDAAQLRAISATLGCIIFPVLYDPAQQDALCKTVVTEVQQLIAAKGTPLPLIEAFSNILLAASVMKSPAFESEREWRIVGFRVAMANKDDVRFRPGRSTLIPYIPIEFPKDDKSPLFTHVYCGPTPHPALAVEAVRGVFRKAQKTIPEIAATSVPFRNW